MKSKYLHNLIPKKVSSINIYYNVLACLWKEAELGLTWNNWNLKFLLSLCSVKKKNSLELVTLKDQQHFLVIVDKPVDFDGKLTGH